VILLTGATGFVGRNLLDALIQNGMSVRCLIAPGRESAWQTLGFVDAEVMFGTLLDEEVLFEAVAGVDTIIHLENAQWWGRARDLERIEIVGTRNLIAAARSARVGHLIVLSHLGASSSSAFNLLRIKGQFESIVAGSGLAYTIIRTGLVFGEEDAFFNHIAMMLRLSPFVFVIPGQGEVVLHPLYIDDLVQSILNTLDNFDVLDRTVEIGGPEYITLSDIVATIMRVTGSYRFTLPLPPYAVRALIRLYTLIFRRTLMTQQWIDILAASRTAHLGNTYSFFGVKPQRFEDTLLQYMPDRRWIIPAIRYVFRRRPRGI